jgi:OCT family organic cation transporter-like MFS transporter 4/5
MGLLAPYFRLPAEDNRHGRLRSYCWRLHGDLSRFCAGNDAESVCLKQGRLNFYNQTVFIRKNLLRDSIIFKYKPPYRCETYFDTNPKFSSLTWDQVNNLTGPSASDCNNWSSGEKGCYHCKFVEATVDACWLKFDDSFDELKNCLGKEAQTEGEWTSCEDEYEFDRSIRNVTNLVFDKDEPWQSAVTQFKLICGMEWFDSLSTAMGLFGLMLGAFVAGLYTDKFGRKNAILVWNFITMALLVIHAFMKRVYFSKNGVTF